MNPLENKIQVINRMLKFIGEYHKAFNKPVPLRILSAKYSRMCISVGGFPEVINQLCEEKAITVLLLKSGAKVVYPPGVSETIIILDAAKL
jgi:hypothetical protein